MMTGLVALPIAALFALSVDINYGATQRSKARESLDSALLAAARFGLTGASQQEIEAEFNRYFDALMATNGGSLTCGTPRLIVGTQTGTLSAAVDCTNDTILAGLVNHDEMNYTIEADVEFGIGKLDVSFVFDVSGSMDDPVASGYNQPSKMSELKTAARTAVAQLLAANSADRDDVRIALVSYNNAINAGPYFQAVTGKTSTRTYTYGGETVDEVQIDEEGDAHGTIFIGLYDRRNNSLVAEIRDGTVLTLPDDLDGNLAIAAEVRSTSNKFGDDESMELFGESDDGWSYTKVENLHPYALYGDSLHNNPNGTYGSGFIPTNVDASIRVRAFTGDNLTGSRFVNKRFDFRINVGEEPISITVTNTCTYERNTSDAFTTAAPNMGNFLTAEDAVYDPDRARWDTPDGCSSAVPVPLTTNATTLNSYINNLPTGGGTAGHLGIAWGRYLIAPEWASAWPNGSTPVAWNAPDTRKIIIMMTDGEFNRTYHGNLGTSFQQAEDQCDAAKAQGVIIYTIAFRAPQEGINILNYCSSGIDYAFDVNNGQELLDAYTTIANRISDLRVAS